MMDSWELYQYLSDICPKIEIVEGVVFLNRSELTSDAFIAIIREYDSIFEAQKWINMVPVDDFLSEVISDWSVDDDNIMEILKVYSRSWLAACVCAGADQDMLRVSCLKDRETGEVIFRLEQEHPAILIAA